MKTKEFIKRVEDLGYTIFSTNERFIQICDHRGRTLAEVSREKLYHINTNKDEPITKTLFDLIVEYACTPVEDRKEEKKFYLRHKWIRKSYDFNYLCFDEDSEIYTLSTCNSKEWKTVFTEKEVEELKEKFDTDLSDFKIIEVK